MPFLFERLEVYQLAVDIAVDIAALADSFPPRTRTLSGRLIRALVSISANIAEGNGRFTKADRRNFFVIARCSASECIPLLEIARRRGLIADDRTEALKIRLDRIARMASGLIAEAERCDRP